MKRQITIVFLLLFISYFDAPAQNSRLSQVSKNPVIKKPASAKAISTFVALFEYVKKAKPDIVQDQKAQERWLTKTFRSEMLAFNAARVEYMKQHPTDKPEYPSNYSFLGVWNKPTTYSIVSARQYDYRNAANPNAYRTTVDVFYEWGHEDTINNQYPGVRNLHSFMFTMEDGSWKLDDIYVYNDEFTTSESLRQYFRTEHPR
jgi:hypothetical protein